MHYPMRLDIATLGESSAAEITRVRTFSCVTTLMSLQWVSSCTSNVRHTQIPLDFLVAKSVVHTSLLCRSIADSLLVCLILKLRWMTLHMVYAQYVLACESQDESFE